MWFEVVNKNRSLKFENIKKLRSAGVPLIAASDSPNMGNLPGTGLHKELQLLTKKGGFTPIEAVAAATYVPGKHYASVFNGKQLGYLKEGGIADLVLINGDFRTDISKVSDIDQVIKAGRLIQRIPVTQSAGQ